MLKNRRKLTAMLLTLAVVLGCLQQTAGFGVKAQAAVKTQKIRIARKTQAAGGKVKKAKKALKKEVEISEPVPATGSAIYDPDLPIMNVLIKQSGDKEVKLSWDAYEGAAGYFVYCLDYNDTADINDGNILSENITVVYDATEAVIPINRGQEYTFCVVAYSGEDAAIARTDRLVACIPEKNSIRFTRLNSKKVKINWNRSEGAQKYIIYKKINGEKYKKLAETDKLKFTDNKVRAGKKYRYYVQSYAIYNEETFQTDANAKSFQIRDFVSTGHQKYSYSEMSGDLKQLVNTYSDYVKVNVIGKSNDKRNIYDVVVGNPNAKKTMLVVSSIHAREYMTAQLCMAQIECYLKNYNGSVNGVRLKSTLKKIAIHYIPMANPDGVTISQFGISRIRDSKLRKALYKMPGAGHTSSWKANARGVDLNRNYKYNYHARYGGRRGSSGYSGPYAESEPETKAIVKLINTLKKNTNLRGTVNYHAMGSIAFGSVRRGMKKTTKSTTIRMYNLARSITGYASSASYEKGGKSVGALREYTMYNMKVPSITLEIGVGGCPLPSSQFGSVWRRNYSLVIREAKLLS
ncbi:hypothetical protein KQI69_05870 [Eubacterium sp. MSJ-13]|uniref:M14 family zinc carboxypeptidase n=1 Tax=Eubacterium sp. MSJ-13 TaxID=2841513 RepID=UPI001C0F9265|nr:M14 family zinc carboxypeptidase [Eubacterium sp. MSJ-13]MBU5478727.1 hypothetical protein [Eubacterium sp. MSJ-13]